MRFHGRLAAAIIAALVLAGCGGSSKDASSSSSQTSTSTTVNNPPSRAIFKGACNGTSQGTTLNAQPKVVAAAFAQPAANDVIVGRPEIAVEPNYNPTAPPTVYFAVCNYAQTPNAGNQASVSV